MTKAAEHVYEHFEQPLRMMHVRRDENQREHEALKATQKTIEGFYVASGKWRRECENMAPSDAHTQRLLEILHISSKSSQLQSASQVEEAFKENRQAALKLSAQEEELLCERKIAQQRTNAKEDEVS